MSYRVSAAGFEGPFDLLLQLVTRQKVDIGAVSVSSIADQYLSEVERMGDLDLEVASDFVLVASTLLDLKAASLVPEDDARPVEEEGLEGLTVDEMREVLVARLLAYRQFRGAALALAARAESQALMRPRTAGPDPAFLNLMPDYLEGVELTRLSAICARFIGRREALLLESEHIAPKRMPLETRVEQVDDHVRRVRHLTFDELLGDDVSVENRVVSLLALLELSKRNALLLTQPETFGTITIDAVEGAPAFSAELDAAELSSEGGEDEEPPAERGPLRSDD